MNLLFKDGLIPAIIVDEKTNEILMLAYMNKESLKKTIEEGRTWFFSRKRNKLWLKGETSGCFQDVSSIYCDCDRDTLLIKVSQKGNACHTGNKTCFFEKLYQRSQSGVRGQESEKRSRKWEVGSGNIVNSQFSILNSVQESGRRDQESNVLKELYEVILDRKKNPKEGSYTTRLFNEGKVKIYEKLREELEEVILDSKHGNKDRTIYETADLLYHLVVLLGLHEITPEDVFCELKRRRK